MAAASPISPSTIPPIGPIPATTPRPMSVALQSQPAPLALSPSISALPDIGAISLTTKEVDDSELSIPRAKMGAADVTENGLKLQADEMDALSDTDGRLTPLASESSRPSRSESSDPLPSSPQSSSFPPTTQSSVASLASIQPSQASFTALPVTPAEIGLSSLGTEKQLRDAATGKDRLLILLIAREMEAFIGRVVNEEQQPFVAPPGASALSVYTMASPLATTLTSKFQRMLVYKAAEWYGLRGISGPDGVIYVGITGTMNEKTPSLHLADLAPKPPTPKQSFKIMQRVPVGSSGSASSRAASAAGDSEASGSRYKTMEEREASYALARERIFKDAEAVDSPESVVAPTAPTEEVERGRTVKQHVRTDEEDDFIPRQVVSSLQPVYASLYHPRPDPPAPPAPYQPQQTQQAMSLQQPYQPADAGYGYQPNMPNPYGYAPPNNGYASPPMGNGYIAQGQQMYPPSNQPYVDGNHQYVDQNNGYSTGQWQQFSAPTSPMMDGNNSLPYPQMPQMGPGYSYPMSQMGGQMPMIPQGAQAYPQQYGYPQQGSPYQQLVQPTPMRPGPPLHQHSSTSSSISSRSYQDYSRPHSRGSTTSTRSAASSVRFGAMYPAQQGGSGSRYRQQGMKGQPIGPSLFPTPNDRRTTRGHSPASNTTTSSRSSRRKASISLLPPTPNQHQLPTRPDWAADNVSYHPAPMSPAQAQGRPMPQQYMQGFMHGQMMPVPMMGANPSDFPPLHRHGLNAEPMQVERAKMVPRGNVWNGNTSRGMRQPVNSPRPNNNGQTPYTGAPASQFTNTLDESARSHTPGPNDVDPDFRRNISAKAPGTLYDPKQGIASSISRPDSSASIRTSTSAVPSTMEGEVDAGISRSAAEAIEAKLAALSVTAGIDIGPPPKSSPSYAKIVRRE